MSFLISIKWLILKDIHTGKWIKLVCMSITPLVVLSSNELRININKSPWIFTIALNTGNYRLQTLVSFICSITIAAESRQLWKHL